MNFDKFVDDILIRENAKKKKDQKDSEQTPQRELAKRYREKPSNRTVYVKK